MTRTTATGSVGDGSAITGTASRKVAQQEVISVGSANRFSQPEGGAAGRGDGSAITGTASRKVAQQEGVMVVPSPKQPAARWRSRK